MTPNETKPLAAALVALLLWFALPMVAFVKGVFPADKWMAAFIFLLATAAVLGCQIIVVAVVTRGFSFTTHGFDLCLTAAVGFLSILGSHFSELTQLQVANAPSNANLVATLTIGGFLGSLILFAFAAYIASKSDPPRRLLPPGWRLFNYALGCSTFTFYVWYMLHKEVIGWNFS